MIYEPEFTDDSDTVGLGTVDDEYLEEYERVRVSVEYLEKAVQFADELGWDAVDLKIDHDNVIMLKPDDADLHMCIAPRLPEAELEELRNE